MNKLTQDLNEGDIVTLKLNSGEELICRYLYQEENTILVKDPASIAPGPQGMGLVPSMFTADPDVEVRINTNSIAMVARSEKEVIAKYMQATSKIVMPDKKIIMG